MPVRTSPYVLNASGDLVAQSPCPTSADTTIIFLPGWYRDAEVLNDDGRRSAGGYNGKLFDGTLKITLVNQGIERDINLLTLGTRIAHEILKFLARKIFRERPSGKFVQRTVNRIGPRAERSQGRIEITGGGEKFRAHKPPKSSVAK